MSETSKSNNTYEISLVELLQVLWEGRKKIAIITSAFTALGLAYALLTTPIFQAETTIMPPQQQQSAAASMMAALGGGALGGGAASALGLKNPNDIYVAMLKSRSIGDSMVKRFDLMKYYHQEIKSNALGVLFVSTTITAGKDGLISIKVEDKDPKLAAEMANAYVEEFRKISKKLAVSEASQRRAYFEEQLKFAKDNLAQAEGELKVFQEKTGLVQADEQGKASIQAMATLRAQIAAKEVELKAYAQFATSANPQTQILQATLGSLRAQLSELTGGSQKDKVFISKGQAPSLSLEYARRFREVKYYEVLFEMMAKQYEMARMDESKDGMTIQVVDKAETPELKIKPKRGMLVILFLISGLLLSISFLIGKKMFGGRLHKMSIQKGTAQ